MEKKVRIVKKGNDESNLMYWLSLSKLERLMQLEEIRKEVNSRNNGIRQGLQRVCRIIKHT